MVLRADIWRSGLLRGGYLVNILYRDNWFIGSGRQDGFDPTNSGLPVADVRYFVILIVNSIPRMDPGVGKDESHPGVGTVDRAVIGSSNTGLGRSVVADCPSFRYRSGRGVDARKGLALK